MLKNFIPYLLLRPLSGAGGGLEIFARTKGLQPCKGASTMTAGFVPVTEDGAMVLQHESKLLFCVGFEEKRIPTSALKAEVDEAAKALEQQQGHKVGKKQLRDLKEKTMLEMLPGTPGKRSRFGVIAEQGAGRLLIECSSRTKAEAVVEFLLNSLDVTGLLAAVDTETSLETTMTAWLTSGEAAGGFSIGSRADLHSDGGGKVSYSNIDLSGPDVKEQLSSGKKVRKLELATSGDATLVLTSKLEVKGIKLPESDAPAEDESLSSEQASLLLSAAGAEQICDGLFIAIGVKDWVKAPCVGDDALSEFMQKTAAKEFARAAEEDAANGEEREMAEAA